MLGVSLTGIMDHPVLSGAENQKELPEWLEELRNVSIETNKEWAEKLGINQSTAITCVKPSGTVSQLVDSASGIHPRFSRFYVRRVRADKKDPLALLMQDQGFPVEDDVINKHNAVFSFPQKAPESGVVVKDVGAMEQLRLWKIYQDHWCEHKPSITVYYTPEEFLEVGAWVYKNFDAVSGISFLPVSEHTYQQAPYEEITEEEYNKLKEQIPEADWSKLGEYETTDDAVNTSKELACSAGVCEVVDLT